MDSLEDNFLKAMSIIMGVLSTPFLYTGVNALINNKPDAWVTISYGIFVLTAMPVIFFGIDFLERHISISCKCENE